jgi:hypothetical protein
VRFASDYHEKLQTHKQASDKQCPSNNNYYDLFTKQKNMSYVDLQGMHPVVLFYKITFTFVLNATTIKHSLTLHRAIMSLLV